MLNIIQDLKGYGWAVTLYDIGDQRPCLVLAIKCLPHEMWDLGRQCLVAGFNMGAAMYSNKSGVVYFPHLEVDAEAYGAIMS